MNVIGAIEIIKEKFSQMDTPAKIPLLKGGTFTATLKDYGIEVDNLGNQPFLPWIVFQEAVCVLLRSGGTALKGDAMGSKLGESGLSLDSIEGHIAYVVYGKKPGDSVFRRITPISCILIWAGICVSRPKGLALSTYDPQSIETFADVLKNSKDLLKIEDWQYFELDFSTSVEQKEEIFQKIKNNIVDFNNVAGIYAIFDSDTCIYIGTSKEIWTRIKSHFLAAKGLDPNERWNNFFSQHKRNLRIFWIEYNKFKSDEPKLNRKLRELFEYVLQIKHNPTFG